MILRQRHLFILDPLQALNLAMDSSLRLAFELVQLGHEVCAAEISDLSWASPSTVAQVSSRRLGFEGVASRPNYGEAKAEPLAEFQGIHMRKDPPYDLDYVTATWFLESACSSSHVFNHPQSLRKFNEKLAILRFPRASKPALASANPKELFEFYRTQAQSHAVLKPLLLFGGRGVIELSGAKTSDEAVLKMITEDTHNGTSVRIIQEFDPAVHEGEVRAFAVGGVPLAWCLKKPAAGNFLANTRAGATLHSYSPSPREIGLVTDVAQELYREGVSVVGFDLLGGFISEANLTSPRLLQGPDDQRNYYKEMAIWFGKKCLEAPE